MDRLSNIDAFLQVVFLAIRHQAQELKEEAVKRKEGEHAGIKTMCLCSVSQIWLPFLWNCSVLVVLPFYIISLERVKQCGRGWWLQPNNRRWFTKAWRCKQGCRCQPGCTEIALSWYFVCLFCNSFLRGLVTSSFLCSAWSPFLSTGPWASPCHPPTTTLREKSLTVFRFFDSDLLVGILSDRIQR